MPAPRCSRRRRSSARSQTGQAQTGEILISIHENEDPIFGIDVVPLPAPSFLRRGEEALARARSRWSRRSSPRRASRLLFTVPWAPQGIYAKKDINTIEDMKGLKWRAYNVGTARIGELVGAQAVTIQAAGAAAGARHRRRQRLHVLGRHRLRLQGVGVAHALLRHPGLDSEGTSPSSTRPRSTRLDKPTQEAVLKAAKAAEERGWKLWREQDRVVPRRDQGEGHEGAAAERPSSPRASRRSASSSPPTG